MFLPRINTPNTIVILRIIAAIVVIIGFGVLDLESLAPRFALAAIFGLASASDWLDGYLARRLNQCTTFGAVFDPLADKILVTSTIAYLAASVDGKLLILALLIFTRDCIVDGIRLVHAKDSPEIPIAAGIPGKIKTIVQMSTLPIAILFWHPVITTITLVLACILSIWSGVIYVRAAKIQLK